MTKKKGIPKETLIMLYLEDKRGMKEIAVMCGAAVATIKARLLEHGIPVRSRAEAQALRQCLGG